MGNEKTLVKSESVWKGLVREARNRQCLFDADADESLKVTIIDVKKDLEQLDDLVNEHSVLFKDAKWKVYRFLPNLSSLFRLENDYFFFHNILLCNILLIL